MSLKNYIIGLSLASLALAPSLYAKPPIQIDSGRFVTPAQDQQRAEEEARKSPRSQSQNNSSRTPRYNNQRRDRSPAQADLDSLLIPINQRVDNLDRDVKKLQGDYTSLKAQLDQYTKPEQAAPTDADKQPKGPLKDRQYVSQPSPENDQLTTLLRQASKQALDELAQRHQTVDTRCITAYTTALDLANEITATYHPVVISPLVVTPVDLPAGATLVELPQAATLAQSVTPTGVGLATDPTPVTLAEDVTALANLRDFTMYVKELDADKTLPSYAKATLLTSELLKFAKNLPDADKQRIMAKVTPAYEQCTGAKSAFDTKEKYYVTILEQNLLETESERRAFIEGIIQSKVPGLIPPIPPSRWSVSPFLGVQYNNGPNGKAGAEVCYKFDGGVDVCVNGAAMLSNSNDQISNSNSQSVAQVGPGYQTSSTSNIATSDRRESHYSLGPRLGLRLTEGKKSSFGLGLSLDLQGGQDTTTTKRSRVTQLQDTNGTNLGDAHNVQDKAEQKQSFRVLIPTLDANLCYDNACIRPSIGYDTDKQAGPLKGFVPGFNLYFRF